MSLNGKRILVTGAARRVGRSLVLGAARAGAEVIIHYNTSQAEAGILLAEVESLGRKAFLLQADLADPDQASCLLPRARELGPVFALVNNAAIFEPLTWDDTRLEDWNRHLSINLTAPFLLSQAFARGLGPDENGRIVNILDWRALRPGSDHFPYTLTKAALAALTSSLAVALAPRVIVNALALGAVLPPSQDPAVRNLTDSLPARSPVGLAELEQALIFLLDGPASIMGEFLQLDGGRHLV